MSSAAGQDYNIPALEIPAKEIQTDIARDPDDVVARPPASLFSDDENDAVGELVPASRRTPAQLTPAERRAHSRKHSRVHSRNLSVFFPQPGTDAEWEQDQQKVTEHMQDVASVNIAPITRPQAFADTSSQRAPPNARSELQIPTGSSGVPTLSPCPTKGRRGHHSKHSVTHDFHGYTSSGPFSEQDLTCDLSADNLHSVGPDAVLSASLERARSRGSHSAYSPDHDHHTDCRHSHTCHHPNHAANTVTRVRIPTPPATLLPTLFYSMAHLLLGSSIWISGQTNDLISVTGLGYLVVFDALGSWNEVLAQWISFAKRDADSKIDRHNVATSYAAHRVPTLLNFVQTIYLLFAAVYLCKESVEHVLLEDSAVAPGVVAFPGAGAASNVLIGDGAGHHHHDSPLMAGSDAELPTILLILATLACLFANLFMSNHARLVAASGLSMTTTTTSSLRPVRRHSRTQSVLVSTTHLAGPLLSLLSNPFSMAVLFFSATLLFSAVTMSSVQIVSLDKVLAGLESVAMWYVALPASKALGKILLQTSPNVNVEEEGGRGQIVQLLRAAKALEENSLISHIARPHVWQLTPSTTSVATKPPSALALSSASTSNSKMAKSPALIASVQIFLHGHASDEDVIKVTRWAYARLAPSVAAGMGLSAGESLRGCVSAGELIVEVKREGEELTMGLDAHASHHHQDNHHHLHNEGRGHTCTADEHQYHVHSKMSVRDDHSTHHSHQPL